MPSKLYKALVASLREHGCEFVRQGKGSHEIWRNPNSGKSFSVPTSLKGEGTYRKILKMAGVDAS